MRGMPKFIKPLIVIILAVGVAAGAAVFLSRGTDKQPAEAANIPEDAEFKGGGGHFRGPVGAEKAELTLVEFGDYQCPSCGAFHPFVQEVLHRYPQVRLEFHHYPLISVHPNALAAAKAAEAAGEQGHYWEMHDALFEYQPQWSGAPDPKVFFSAMANRIGINGAILLQTMESPAIQQRILEDVQRGDDAKVDATPTFYINGKKVPVSLSMEDFTRVIESHLHK